MVGGFLLYFVFSVHPPLNVLQFVPMARPFSPRPKFGNRPNNRPAKTPFGNKGSFGARNAVSSNSPKTPIRSTSVPGMSIGQITSKLNPSSRTIHKPAKAARGPSPIPKKAPGEYPMRINKYLGFKGYSTRRGADDLIARRMVTINGRFAALGDQVNENDTVEVRNMRKPETYSYYAYNKPRGVSTDPTRKGTLDISQSIPLTNVFPVGGLDTNAEGLVILTNDRRITDRLLNPAHEHMKEFIIQTITPLRSNFKEKMESGVVINGSKPLHYSTKIINDHLFTVRLSDSGSHLRQMCSMFFAEIESLKRTQIMNVTLGKLSPNEFRRIEGEELTGFLRALGL